MLTKRLATKVKLSTKRLVTKVELSTKISDKVKTGKFDVQLGLRRSTGTWSTANRTLVYLQNKSIEKVEA